MNVKLENIKYHRGKEAVPINEAQALLMISDLITAALAQNGFTAEVSIE